MKTWSNKAIVHTAELINKEVENNRGFWACGIIKETLPLWKDENNYNLLTEFSQVIADHYLEESQQTV
jgi:hypothetical protein